MSLRIDEIRAERGMRKAELARRAGLTQSNLNAAINNGNPTIETQEKIAKAVDVEVYELLTDRLPSRPEGVVYLGEQAYALVKCPDIVQLPNYADTMTLEVEVLRFVMACVKWRKTASMSGLSKGTNLFTIFYDPDSETERIFLNVFSGRDDTYTGVYLQDEYQEETDGTSIIWEKYAIMKELCHDIEGVDRGKRLHNTCVSA